MILCYVDDVLSISETPMITIEVIKSVFKLNGDKAEVPYMYLGASIQKLEFGWHGVLDDFCREIRQGCRGEYQT